MPFFTFPGPPPGKNANFAKKSIFDPFFDLFLAVFKGDFAEMPVFLRFWVEKCQKNGQKVEKFDIFGPKIEKFDVFCQILEIWHILAKYGKFDKIIRKTFHQG